MVKYNIKYVKEYIENLGYIFINYEYDGNKYVLFKDIYGYIYYTLFYRLISNQFPDKFSKFNPYTIHNIKLWCRQNNKLFKLISEEYNGNNKKLKWQCLNEECNNIFSSTWQNILSGGNCYYCNCLVIKNPELAKEWHPTKNGNLTPYDVSINSGKKVWWECKNYHEWEAVICNRNHNNRNCPYCAHQLPSKEYNLLVVNPKLCEEWDYNKNIKNPEDYLPNGSQKVWWICKTCNASWEARIYSRNCRNCPICRQSKGEIECRDWLYENNILFEREYIFNDLKDKDFLRFDFAIFNDIEQINLKCLIEYDGEGHYSELPFGKKSYLSTVKHDKMKNEYCLNNNIILIRIPYWDFDNIEDILNTFLRNEEIIEWQSIN